MIATLIAAALVFVNAPDGDTLVVRDGNVKTILRLAEVDAPDGDVRWCRRELAPSARRPRVVLHKIFGAAESVFAVGTRGNECAARIVAGRHAACALGVSSCESRAGEAVT